MKRIVNGVTYNTDTSTALARMTWEKDGRHNQASRGIDTLYQTRGGAFFIDEEETLLSWNERAGEHEEATANTFLPLSADDAHKWMMEGDIEVFHNPFGDPPEAAAEPESGATIYLRVPASLKQRVDDAAKEAGLSGNVWAMRCVENCLEEARGSRPPVWILREPTVTEGDDPRIALKVAVGWPTAMLTRAHAAHLSRQLLRAVDGTRTTDHRASRKSLRPK
jgi:hypothetical protein